ncbi:IS630 family transposase [Desulfovibrio inopinatus]|uniref:IS630 family transposase n=1 Tax=Desulfovibrio inopinatus TaxID=102109 RepID=UPI001B7F7BFD|nr:IS630 family transposase [Desulfovibrio inopinatus]
MEKKLKFIVQDNTQGWQEDLPLRLMFQDEARFGLISEARRCWCPKPERPICKTMISQQYTYAYSAVSILEGNMDSLVLPYVKTSCMQIFLNEVSSRYPNERILMIADGAGWHKSKSLIIPWNIKLIIQPPYSPELNPVEHIWDEVKEKYFHNRVFDDLASLENHLVSSLSNLETDHKRVKSIVAWQWIIKAISN